jgi:hypothetical protein
MTTTTMQLFDWQLKMLQPKKLPTMTDPEQLVPVTFELYPVEVLEAAQKALGIKALNEYAVNLYKFTINSKASMLPVKVSQLSGVLLTQGKLDAWFNAVKPKELLNSGVKEEVFLAYVNYHKARIEESEAVMATLRKMCGVEE